LLIFYFEPNNDLFKTEINCGIVWSWNQLPGRSIKPTLHLFVSSYEFEQMLRVDKLQTAMSQSKQQAACNESLQCLWCPS